jgi:hypothetical protein
MHLETTSHWPCRMPGRCVPPNGHRLVVGSGWVVGSGALKRGAMPQDTPQAALAPARGRPTRAWWPSQMGPTKCTSNKPAWCVLGLATTACCMRSRGQGERTSHWVPPLPLTHPARCPDLRPYGRSTWCADGHAACDFNCNCVQTSTSAHYMRYALLGVWFLYGRVLEPTACGVVVPPQHPPCVPFLF